MAADDHSTGLPASFETAWGLRDRPVKGPKPGMSLNQIVSAAVEIAEVDGVAAVSMGRVAAHLGTKTMSLYRYISAKDELLALMIDMVLGAPPPLDPDWRKGLSGWARAQHKIFREHSWVLRLPMSAPTTPNQIAWLESGLSTLAGTGLSQMQMLSIVLLVGGYVRNEATLVAEVNTAFRASGAEPNEALRAYGTLLGKLATPERFPTLRAAIDAGVFERVENPGEEFEFGLERVLDGTEALIAAAHA